jgi:hypothetical protein
MKGSGLLFTLCRPSRVQHAAAHFAGLLFRCSADSMRVEDIVASSLDENILASGTQDEVRRKIVALIVQLEKIPLRSRDVQLVRDSLASTMEKFQLEDDPKLVSVIEARFSFEFIPGITKLNTERPRVAGTRKDEASINELNEDTKPHRQSESGSVGEHETTGANVEALRVLSGRKVYYLCSIRRHQSALWTTYHMFLDGTREFESNGSLAAAVMHGAPMALLGAKKFKSGSAAQCLIWNLPDMKQWKDKNAIGRLSRQQNAVYYGVPFVEQPSMGAGLSLLSPIPHSASTASLDTAGTASSSHNPTPAASPRLSNVGIAIDTLTADEPIPPAPLSATNRQATARWSFRASGGAAPLALAHPTAPPTAPAVSNDGAIALALSSTGMDKLIQLSGVSARKPAPATIPTSRNASSAALDSSAGTDEGNGSGTPSTHSRATYTPAFTESQLLEKLDALVRKETAPSDFISNSMLLLRSRLPRKVPSTGGKTTYALPFGDVTRVRTTSRKNLVVDVVTASSSAEEVEQAAEWTEDRSKPALLQVNCLVPLRYIAH